MYLVFRPQIVSYIFQLFMSLYFCKIKISLIMFTILNVLGGMLQGNECITDQINNGV